MKITRIAMLLLLGVLLVFLLPVPMATADAVVTFPDPNLEAVIREAIAKPVGDIYESDLLGLTELYAWYGAIIDLDGLEYCTNLTSLYLLDNQISDISPLSSLTSLRVLYLFANQISDMSPLSSLTSLTKLYLYENQISDIPPLSSLTSLTYLDLSWNQISDISSLYSLTSLTELYLFGNQISDLSPLSSLTSLKELYLSVNQISDLSPLSSLTSLKVLSLHANQISDLSPLSSLLNLTELGLWSNQISDISPLSSLPNLTELGLGSNQISDIEPLVDNPGLSSGSYIDITDNQLSTTSINAYIPQLKARGIIVQYNTFTPPLWLWIVIGFTGVLLVPLAVIVYLPVKKKKPDYPECKGKVPIGKEKDHDGFLLEQTENTSGQGKLAKIPIEIRGWNWGAFFLDWIWGVGNSVWIALLCLIPFVSFIMRFVLGAKGNEWAWQNRKWDSIEHFKRTQRKWSWWGLGITVGLIVYYSILYTIMFIGL